MATNPDELTVDTEAMRNAANSLEDQRKLYKNAIDDLGQLITVTLGQYWVGKGYDKVRDNYVKDSSKKLEELNTHLSAFYKKWTGKSDDFDDAEKRVLGLI